MASFGVSSPLPGDSDYLPRLPRDPQPCGGCGVTYVHDIGDCLRNLNARICQLETRTKYHGSPDYQGAPNP